MAKDIIHDDEFYEEIKRPVKSTKPSGGGTTLKDYVIVALIAIVAVMGINNVIFARGSGGGLQGGGGGCCGGGAGGAVSAPSTEELRQQGLEFYVATYNDTDVEAVVQDFGCHQEVNIYKDGELIKRLGYSSGQIYEIS